MLNCIIYNVRVSLSSLVKPPKLILLNDRVHMEKPVIAQNFDVFRPESFKYAH